MEFKVGDFNNGRYYNDVKNVYDDKAQNQSTLGKLVNVNAPPSSSWIKKKTKQKITNIETSLGWNLTGYLINITKDVYPFGTYSL